MRATSPAESPSSPARSRVFAGGWVVVFSAGQLALGLFGGAAWAQTTCTNADTAVTAVNPGDAGALAGDCAALLGVRDTLRGAGTLNWENTLSMASWDGVTLASDNNRVTELGLSIKELSGSIPDLSALTSLTSLNLSANGLTGSIVAAHFPASLRSLWLPSNELTGSIPDLSALTSLTNLTFSTNGLTGSIVAAHSPPASGVSGSPATS